MLNVVSIMGRLTKKPELKQTPSGNDVCVFTVAVDRDAKGEDGTRQADFLDIIAWKGTARLVADRFDKGQGISITGRLQTRTWKDKSGNPRKTTEIIASQVYFPPSSPAATTSSDGQLEDDDDSLPF